jgi:hypothetical protein
MKTDMKLKQDVEEELDWTPDVDATHIGVEVRDGVVTLSGHPASYAEKLAAEVAAQRVSSRWTCACPMQRYATTKRSLMQRSRYCAGRWDCALTQ